MNTYKNFIRNIVTDRTQGFPWGIVFSLFVGAATLLKPLWVARVLLVLASFGIAGIVLIGGGCFLVLLLQWTLGKSSPPPSLPKVAVEPEESTPVTKVSTQGTSLTPAMTTQVITPQVAPLPEIVPQALPELIVLKNISKVYGMGDTEVHALRSVDLTIFKGEYCAIMGPSGSGKSTAMNMIGCLDRPTAGDYLLDGENVAYLSEKILANIRNRKIGFVFQQFHLLPQLSAMENVMLPMVYAGVSGPERQERARKALEQVGLGHRLQNRPNQLSGGQQQRVAIARAIVNQPVLLLADEPTGALDTHTTSEILEIFSTLNAQGMTVVVVTHESEVARQTHRIIWFRDGQVANDRILPEDLGTVL